MTDTAGLADWIERQERRSIAAIERAISASRSIRRRAAFGQTVRPSAGSVLASPEIADWDPEPDYFFHWLRDSAIVMRAVTCIMRDASDTAEAGRWRRCFADFVRFSLKLSDPDEREHLAAGGYRQATRPDHRRFLRPEREILELTGDRLLGEPRFNPDGTIDIQRWSRPQYDGPALRALACLCYLDAGGTATDELHRLLRTDIDFTMRHAGQPCIGPWEEPGQTGHHYFVAAAQLGALVHAAAHLGDVEEKMQRAERRLRDGLDRHWSEPHQVYMAIRDTEERTKAELLDSAVLLGILEADLPDGPHSVQDPRVQSTQAAIERLFARELPINRTRPPGCGPALGRYSGDTYFGGGAWYPVTLAAASLCYRLAQCTGQDPATQIRRGDAFMATIRELTPAGGALSEQVDRTTGKPTSARHLTWSYAAFVEAAHLRRQAERGGG